MKLGISNQGMRRLARVVGMSFLADPPVPLSEKYKGIIEYPGFHTTTSFDIAAAYAVGRVSQSYTDEDENGQHYVTDFPVVVEINMAGHAAEVDYDAVEIVLPVLKIHMGELVGGSYDTEPLSVESTDEEIFDRAQEFIDGSTEDDKEYDNPISSMGDIAMSNMNNPINMIYEDPEFPNAVRRFIQSGEVPENLLMKSTDQFRYTQDVNENRIVAVYYVWPVADEMADEDSWEDDEDEEDPNSLSYRWPGFDLKSQEDLYDGSSFSSKQVWTGEATGIQEEGDQLSLFTQEQAPLPENLQYHGTTYSRLLQAAPQLDGQLPELPSPPFRGE